MSDSIINEAIKLRKADEFDESRNLLVSLLEDAQFQARADLHIAWSYDNEGKEQEAIAHYESALSGLLPASERFNALLGLASTLRSLGRFADALPYFEKALSEYPEAVEIQPFYAICLYNLGRHKEATSLLLKLLVSTTNSDPIRNYKRAILLYADDLDQTW